MRMWMVDPALMCRQHLLGEHVEIHMLYSHLKAGRRIDGFLHDGLLEPGSIETRHAVLASEMVRRGYRHQSPLTRPIEWEGKWRHGYVNIQESLKELHRRCAACKARSENN